MASDVNEESLIMQVQTVVKLTVGTKDEFSCDMCARHGHIV